MTRKIVLFAVMFFAITHLWSQSNTNSRIPLLGEDAPAFTAQSTKGTIEFPGDYGRKWKVILSHPADFTPVCTSEIMELAQMQKDFKDLNVQLIVVSTDDLERHQSWVKSMEEMLEKENKATKINFPLVDDSKLGISWEYGMLTPSVDSRKAVRGEFIIDPNNKIQSISFYPKDVGRNLDELKRTIIALQTAQKHTVLTPVNWKPGDDVLLPYPTSYTYYNENRKRDDKLYDVSGLMLYKKLKE